MVTQKKNFIWWKRSDDGLFPASVDSEVDVDTKQPTASHFYIITLKCSLRKFCNILCDVLLKCNKLCKLLEGSGPLIFIWPFICDLKSVRYYTMEFPEILFTGQCCIMWTILRRFHGIAVANAPFKRLQPLSPLLCWEKAWEIEGWDRRKAHLIIHFILILHWYSTSKSSVSKLYYAVSA